MSSVHTNRAVVPAKGTLESTTRVAKQPERLEQAWRHWLVVVTLVFSDILLALLGWGFSLPLQNSLRNIPLSELLSHFAIALVIPNIVLWVGTRALLGLYPGYGLNSAEELRRQTYAV